MRKCEGIGLASAIILYSTPLLRKSCSCCFNSNANILSCAVRNLGMNLWGASLCSEEVVPQTICNISLNERFFSLPFSLPHPNLFLFNASSVINHVNSPLPDYSHGLCPCWDRMNRCASLQAQKLHWWSLEWPTPHSPFSGGVIPYAIELLSFH